MKLELPNGEHNRIRDKNERHWATDYSRQMTARCGEYIDQFTTVPDLRTTEEILARKPKCCQ